MKRIIAINIIILICISGNAQSFELRIEDVQKIILIDHRNNNYSRAYGTIYELKPKEDKFKLYQTERYFKNISQSILDNNNIEPSRINKFLGDLPKSDIEDLIASINDSKYETMQLEQFGFTTTYLKDNSERIAKGHNEYDKLKKHNQDYFIQQLQDKEKIEEILSRSFGSWSRHDYPTCIIQFVRSEDTIQIFSQKTSPYMIPWTSYNFKKSYNISISKFFASIIPYNSFSNKSRLESKNKLEENIARKIYTKYCKAKFERDELDELLAKEVDLISQNFDVSNIFIGSMSSIDWDVFKEGRTWSAKFHDKNQPKNLIFDVTMDNNETLGSVKPLLEQKEDIFKRIYKVDFLMNHILENSNRILKIHFVRDKSFSPTAQESFLNNTPSSYQTALNKGFNKTILFTLSNENGWSRWLIFPDGKIMLWHYHGQPPFNNYTEEQIKVSSGPFINSYKLFDTNGELRN